MFVFLVVGLIDDYSHRTLTKPVELLTCLKSIKEHAFVTSEYPVVLTLEDHLSPDLQAVVAKVNSCFTENKNK